MNRFRSQPTLMRSGGRSPLPVLAVALVAAVGAGVVIADRAPDWWPERTTPQPVAAAPGAQPARPAAPLNAAVAAASAAVAQPPVRSAPAPAPVQAPAVTVAAPVARERAPETATASSDSPADSREAWERQRREYDRELEAYQERERSAGFAWARSNQVATAGYCQATRQRTAAFADGCLDYLRVNAD